jgi:hypothetical protein
MNFDEEIGVSGADGVRRLCALLRAEVRPRGRFDWAVIEEGLGLRLPADYKP